MNKLLIISGPTSTGKTKLAIDLAHKFNGELISADSRQIYKGMDIGTGKDHPKNIPIHLINVINPNQTFSVVEYQKLAKSIIEEIYKKGKLPIIVGGTGLYIDSLIGSQNQTYHIKPMPILRFFLNRLSTKWLQKIYSILDKKAFHSLNNSEKHNPHRLIRKIEIKLHVGTDLRVSSNTKTKINFLHLSLTAPNPYIYQQIDKRVENRIKDGLIKEIEKLLKKYKWSDPGLNTLAYKEFKPFFVETHSVRLKNNKPINEDLILNQCVQQWKYDEHALVRRQKTWFKNQPNIHIFNITSTGCYKNILYTITKWYNTE